MKTKKIYIVYLLTAFLVVGCDDFLDTPPQDELIDESYWSSEENVETYAYDFYPRYFKGYGSSYDWGKFFSGEAFNDDFAATSPPPFPLQVPTTTTSTIRWTFSWVRKANIMIERVSNMGEEDISEEARNHWIGIGRFFRGMAYFDIVHRYGDVPWYDRELTEDETEELYKPREARETVMARVLEDFQYAAENVRETVPEAGLMVNRDVVLGFMSRVFLFEGTWQKYQEDNTAEAVTFLEAAQWAARQVIDGNNYQVSDDYRALFASESLAGNPEVMLYREYQEGLLTHVLMSYNNSGEPQTGISRDAVMSYLDADGMPVTLRMDDYRSDEKSGIEEVASGRDPRLSETVVPYEVRIQGDAQNYSTSGYAVHKYLNEELKDEVVGFSNLNITDSPVLRYGEVLLNYVEATAELAELGSGTLTQDDLNISINQLRARTGVEMPDLQIQGSMPAANGQTYDDPERDPDVSAILWEIRRERRVELMMEGFRNNDLRRWAKFEKLDMIENTNINRGAWIRLADYGEGVQNLNLTEGSEGYIIPATAQTTIRTFDDSRVYLSPIPLDQITLYSDYGVELEQNPGW